MKRLLSALFLLLFLAPANATTIAFDGSMIAADEQHTAGNAKHMGAKKIVYFPERHCWVAGAGECAKIQAFFRWFPDQDKTVIISGEYQMMVIAETGDLTIYQGSNKEPVPMTAPFAMGSGQDFAMGAMAAGKTAKEAIAITEDLDIYTGGKIQVITLPKPGSSR